MNFLRSVIPGVFHWFIILSICIVDCGEKPITMYIEGSRHTRDTGKHLYNLKTLIKLFGRLLYFHCLPMRQKCKFRCWWTCKKWRLQLWMHLMKTQLIGTNKTPSCEHPKKYSFWDVSCALFSWVAYFNVSMCLLQPKTQKFLHLIHPYLSVYSGDYF